MSDTKILFVGHSLSVQSASGTVLLELLKRFNNQKNFKVAYAAVSGREMDLEKVEKIYNTNVFSRYDIPLYNVQLTKHDTALQFDKIVENFRPNIVFSLHDPWYLDSIAYSDYKDTFMWIAYSTVEVPKYPEYVIAPTPILSATRKSIKEIWSFVDVLVPITEMGENAFFDLNLNYVDKIYCGVNLSSRQNKKELKSVVFGNVVPDDSFLFMSVGVNNERKKFDRLLEAFRLFLDKVTNPIKYKLYIHSDTNKNFAGTDLVSAMQHLFLQKNIIFCKPNSVYSIEDLYRRYNACDCYVSLTGGEGFGYGFVEAMLHSKPLIYTNYGGHVEFCKDFGLPVKVNDHFYASNAFMKFALADLEDASNQMLKISQDEQLRNSLSEHSYKFVCENFDWEKQFKKILVLVNEEYYKWTNGYNKINAKFNLKRIV